MTAGVPLFLFVLLVSLSASCLSELGAMWIWSWHLLPRIPNGSRSLWDQNREPDFLIFQGQTYLSGSRTDHLLPESHFTDLSRNCSARHWGPPAKPHSPSPATWKRKLSEDPVSLESDKEKLFHVFHIEWYRVGQPWVSSRILQNPLGAAWTGEFWAGSVLAGGACMDPAPWMGSQPVWLYEVCL